MPATAQRTISKSERDRAKERSKQGCSYLLQGRFDVGWKEYEWRFVANGKPRNLPQALWRGQPLSGRTLLVHREQGVGDEILYSTCFPDLLRLAQHCTFTCDVRLAPLFRRSFPAATVYSGKPMNDDWHRWVDLPVDFQTPAGNVPRYLRSDAASFPDRVGFLIPDPDRVARWRERLARLGPGLKVGISWQGGMDLLNLRRAPWDVWRRIFRTEGVHFVNLQYGDCAQQLAAFRRQWGVEVHDWAEADPWNDLDGMAAQIAALDLVITVPNTTVHLAAALGQTVWVVFDTPWGCWWILNGVKSLWYPSVKVYRKSKDGGWASVTEPLGRDLAQLAARRT